MPTDETNTVQYLANCEGFIPLDPKIANDNRNLPDTEILVLFVKVINSILFSIVANCEGCSQIK